MTRLGTVNAWVLIFLTEPGIGASVRSSDVWGKKKEQDEPRLQPGQSSRGVVRMRKYRFLVATLVAGGLMAAAAFAYACTAVATISVRPGAVKQGQAITGTGKGFSRTGKPVRIRFESLSGRVRDRATVSPTGEIDFSFKAPKVRPGNYTVIASQKTMQGENVYGTPARDSVRIRSAR